MRRLGVLAVGLVMCSSPAFGQSRTLAGGAVSRAGKTTLVTIGAHGSRAALRFDAGIVCGGDFYPISGRRVVSFNRLGLLARGRGRVKLVRGSVRFRWRIRARLDSQGGRGKLVLHGRRRGRPCRADRRRFRVRPTADVRSKRAAPRTGAVYYGSSAQPIRPVRGTVVRVRKHRRIVASWRADARCVGGGSVPVANFTPSTRVRHGRFKRRERYRVGFGGGGTNTYRVVFGGRFTRRGASGKLRARVILRDRHGRRYATCSTTGIPWSTVRAGAYVPPPGGTPAAGAWRLTYESDADDPVGEGRSGAFGPPADALSTRTDDNHVGFLGDGDDGTFGLDLAAPAQHVLTAGTYSQARRYTPHGGFPGLYFSLDSYTCGDLSGSFTVEEVSYDVYGVLRALRASFERHCGDRAAGLRGTMEFHKR